MFHLKYPGSAAARLRNSTGRGVPLHAHLHAHLDARLYQYSNSGGTAVPASHGCWRAWRPFATRSRAVATT